MTATLVRLPTSRAMASADLNPTPQTSSASRYGVARTTSSWLASARMHPINDCVTRLCQVVPIVLLARNQAQPLTKLLGF